MTFSRRKIFILAVIILIILFWLSRCQNKEDVHRPRLGRDYRYISVHPNDQDMLFIECNDKLSTRCGVFRYDLSTQQLYRYNLPEGYVYHSARFSPKGNYIVMHRLPFWDESEEKSRRAFELAEILIMRVNGQDLYIVPMLPGANTMPVMSNNEDKIAYWSMRLREPGSKSFASNYNLWEVNLQTREDKLFAGDFQFFTISNAQYLPGDKSILIGGYGPMKEPMIVQSPDSMEQYKKDAIYILHRGDPILPKPMFPEVEYVTDPSMDNTGNIYFRGQTDRLRFFKAIDGRIAQEWPIKSTFLNGQELIVNPSGSALFFTYELSDDDSRFGRHSKDIGKFDFATQTWQTFSIPPFDQAKLIDVAFKRK